MKLTEVLLCPVSIVPYLLTAHELIGSWRYSL